MIVGNVAKIEDGKWRIDEDGFLRVTACVLKPGVYDYGVDELPENARSRFCNAKKVTQAVVADEFTDEALASLEGKPVIMDARTDDHDWRTTKSDPALEVGSVAGKPRVAPDGSILADLLIKRKDAIDAIINDRRREISAAYDASLDDGAKMNADFVQRHHRFNHVLLIPTGKGRCGPDVKILNRKGQESVTTIRIGNAFMPKFEESKHKRGPKGQFADKPGRSVTPAQRHYDAGEEREDLAEMYATGRHKTDPSWRRRIHKLALSTRQSVKDVMRDLSGDVRSMGHYEAHDQKSGNTRPEGRVITVNTVQEGASKMVKVKVGNAEYDFPDEAKESAEKLAGDVNDQLEEKEETIQVHLAKLAEVEELLKKASEQLAAFKEQEDAEDHEEEVAALENCTDEKGKDAMKAAVANCKTVAEKRKALFTHVMNVRGVKGVDKYTDEQVVAGMQVLVAEAKRQNQQRTKNVGTILPDAGRIDADHGGQKPHPVHQRV